MKKTVGTADGGWLHYAWLLPAALGAAVTALLCWAAWVTAWPVRWPDLYHAWWWTLLRPDQDGTLLVTAALWGASLACYAWPRRFLHLPIGLITVVAMIFIGGALVTTSLVPCRGEATATGVFGWLLDIYLGQPPPPFAPRRLHGNDAAGHATRADRLPRRHRHRRPRRRGGALARAAQPPALPVRARRHRVHRA